MEDEAQEARMLAWADSVTRVARGMSWASLGAVAVPLSTALFPEKRAFPARQPLYLCLAVAGLVAVLLAGLYDRRGACAAQALGITFFGNATVAWWLVVSHTAYSVVACARSARAARHAEKWTLLLGWGLPAALTLAAHLLGALDTEPSPRRWECWVNRLHSVDQWLFFYGEMGLACLVGLLYLWPRVARLAWHAGGMHVRHLFFMAIFLIVFGVSLSYRIVDDYRGAGYTLTVAHTVVVCGVGVWVFLIFGATRRNAELWAGLVLDGSLRGGRFGRGTSGEGGGGSGGARAGPVTPAKQGRSRDRRREGSPLLQPHADRGSSYYA